MKTPRVSAAAALLAAASIAAVAAAVEPRIQAGRGPVLRILCHDASASCGAHAAPDEDEIAALLHGLGSADLVGVISFGAHLGLVVPECAPSELRSRLADAAAHAPSADPHGSSLFTSLAGEARPRTHDGDRDASKRNLEIVLATDRLATDGSAPWSTFGETARLLREAGCLSLRVLRRTPVKFPSLVAELRGPGAARVGEPFALEARGVAAGDGALVEISDASGVVESRRVDGAGPFRLAFTRIEETAGPATFTARVAGTTDVPPSIARIAVTAPGRALVVGVGPRREGLRAALGADATWCDVRDATAALLAAHDVVIVDDLSAAQLAEMDEALADFVRGGGGVLLLGGPRAFGAGGWAGRPVERISPLVARPRGESGTLVYLALDASGSMAEPWGDAPGAATRDAVARQAAKSLMASAAADTSIAIRRFASDLSPDRTPPSVLDLGDAEDRARADGLVDGFPAPGGSTALLPPLREALSTAASRTQRRKQAIVLTDGRTPESAADLHDALVALDAAGVRVAFVLPGFAVLDDEARTLRDALRGTRAEVRGAADPDRLAQVFRDVEEKARVDEPVVTDRRLAADPSAAALVRVVPEFASRVDRTWLAEGATLLAATDHGEPVAALRRTGLGVVAALATSPGDPEWLAAGERTNALVRALARAAARGASGRVRVERDGDARLLVRFEASPGGAAAAYVEWTDADRGRRRAPLVPAEGGLLAADLGSPGIGAPEWIDLDAEGGRVVATVGLDVPAPAEYRDPPPADLDALAALACGREAPASTSLLPWLAGASAALALAALAAGRVKSRAPHAR